MRAQTAGKAGSGVESWGVETGAVGVWMSSRLEAKPPQGEKAAKLSWSGALNGYSRPCFPSDLVGPPHDSCDGLFLQRRGWMGPGTVPRVPATGRKPRPPSKSVPPDFLPLCSSLPPLGQNGALPAPPPPLPPVSPSPGSSPRPAPPRPLSGAPHPQSDRLPFLFWALAGGCAGVLNTVVSRACLGSLR